MGFCGPVRNDSLMVEIFRDIVGLNKKHDRFRKFAFAVRDLVDVDQTRELHYKNGNIKMRREVRPNSPGAPGLREYEYLRVTLDGSVVLSYDDNSMKGIFIDGPWVDDVFRSAK